MASPSLPIECGICLEEYNNTTRRPRALPCTHNFCAMCLQKSLAQGANMCSICRKVHTATSIDEIPINTDLEKFIQMWSLMSLTTTTTNNKIDKTIDDGEDFCLDYCTRHSKSLLYFKCKTHGIDICRECTVIHHPQSKCNIIELKDEVMNQKEETKSKALKVIDELNSETSSLEIILSEAKASVVSKQSDIERLSKEMGEESIVCENTESYISENKRLVFQLQKCIEELNEASNDKSVRRKCTETQNEIEAAGKCSNNIEKYFFKILLKDQGSALKFMKKRKLDIYTVEEERNASSKLITALDGRLQFSSLEKNIIHTTNSITIPVSSLLSIVGMQPVVYLDLIGGEYTYRRTGRQLGRVRIRLTCSPKRQERMLQIFSGMKGKSLKGSCFNTAWSVGRNGEGLGCYHSNTSDDSTDISTAQDQEEPECERHVEGNVTGFVDDANFMICTRTHRIKASSTSWTAPRIGHVVSGINILKNALSRYAMREIGPFYDSKDIGIFDTGVEISNHQQNYIRTSQHCESDVPSYEKTTWAKDNRRIRNNRHIYEPYSEVLINKK